MLHLFLMKNKINAIFWAFEVFISKRFCIFALALWNLHELAVCFERQESKTPMGVRDTLLDFCWLIELYLFFP